MYRYPEQDNILSEATVDVKRGVMRVVSPYCIISEPPVILIAADIMIDLIAKGQGTRGP